MTGGAAAEMAFDVELPDRQQRGHDQVPDAGHQQQRNGAVVHGVDELRRIQQIAHGDHADQRGGLEHRDRLVAGGRHDDPHGLRQHHASHDLQPRHAQGGPGLALAFVHRQNARAHDLGHVSAFVEA